MALQEDCSRTPCTDVYQAALLHDVRALRAGHKYKGRLNFPVNAARVGTSGTASRYLRSGAARSLLAEEVNALPRAHEALPGGPTEATTAVEEADEASESGLGEDDDEAQQPAPSKAALREASPSTGLLYLASLQHLTVMKYQRSSLELCHSLCFGRVCSVST